MRSNTAASNNGTSCIGDGRNLSGLFLPRTNMTSPETLLPQAATDAAMKLAMDTLKQVPKRDPQVLEAHLTAVLIVFWGALWGTLGTEYARGFIEAQLRSMEDDVPHDVFVEAKAH
jgi:hypothetical protein